MKTMTTTKELKVYLAGKIKQNGWRQEIVDIRDNFYGDNPDAIINAMLPYNTIINNLDVKITGPFFLSCDHGCYHGENNHGVGINNYFDCCGVGRTFTSEEVHKICLEQIEKSDVVFAYIDSNECYGTLFEIGYAKALGKCIFILFDDLDRFHNMWFINESAFLSFVKNKNMNIEYYFKLMILSYEFFKENERE